MAVCKKQNQGEKMKPDLIPACDKSLACLAYNVYH